ALRARWGQAAPLPRATRSAARWPPRPASAARRRLRDPGNPARAWVAGKARAGRAVPERGGVRGRPRAQQILFEQPPLSGRRRLRSPREEGRAAREMRSLHEMTAGGKCVVFGRNTIYAMSTVACTSGVV